MLEVKNIKKSYGRFEVLRGVNLRVKKGEILGVIGPNGAGKTTLMRIMAGIKRRDGGEVSLLQTDPFKNNKIKKKIGFMPERVYFEDEMKGETFLRIMGRFWKLDKNRIYEVLEKCGIKDASKKEIKKYSKGMEQRILLAQTLLNDPEILFLDEPNSGIDPVGTKEIRDIILNMKEKGKTFIINSHQLTELERVCTRVVFLKAGKIVYEIETQNSKDEYSLEVIGNKKIVGKITEELNLIYKKKDDYYLIKINGTEKKDMILKKLLNERIKIEALKKNETNLEALFFKYVGENQK